MYLVAQPVDDPLFGPLRPEDLVVDVMPFSTSALVVLLEKSPLIFVSIYLSILCAFLVSTARSRAPFLRELRQSTCLPLDVGGDPTTRHFVPKEDTPCVRTVGRVLATPSSVLSCRQ
jgi:hypothetical protein